MNFKSYSKSHKLKKRKDRDCFPAWYIVQTAGVNYTSLPVRVLTAHFIREEVLKQIVWGRIFDVDALFYDDIVAFKEMMYAQRSAETEKEMKRRKREVGQAQKRIVELSCIFKQIYEDDISGAISHDRFLKLSAEYGAEQRELEEKVKSEQQEVDTYEQNKSDLNSFSAIIRKYVGIKELTPQSSMNLSRKS